MNSNFLNGFVDELEKVGGINVAKDDAAGGSLKDAPRPPAAPTPVAPTGAQMIAKLNKLSRGIAEKRRGDAMIAKRDKLFANQAMLRKRDQLFAKIRASRPTNLVAGIKTP